MTDKQRKMKCVIWDLDNTLWEGILLEGDDVKLRPKARETLEELDRRGILNSICSKNNHDDAMAKLKQLGVDHLFLYPQISWNAKSAAVGTIQKKLNIGIDTFMFLDDQPFELDEVSSEHPAVMCLNSLEYADDLSRLLELPELNPLFITQDSARRRQMYLDDMNRAEEEQTHEGPKQEFLAKLNMTFSISHAKEEDLRRAEELTVRTNQLNATGRTYDYDELRQLMTSPDHRLLVCELTDRYGSYGKIGLALLELGQEIWRLKLLLMSCRVMSRGVGTVLMSYVMQQAVKAGVRLQADFVDTGRNELMYVAFKFAGFEEQETQEDGTQVMETDLNEIQKFPDFIVVQTPEAL